MLYYCLDVLNRQCQAVEAGAAGFSRESVRPKEVDQCCVICNDLHVTHKGHPFEVCVPVDECLKLTFSGRPTGFSIRKNTTVIPEGHFPYDIALRLGGVRRRHSGNELLLKATRTNGPLRGVGDDTTRHGVGAKVGCC